MYKKIIGIIVCMLLLISVSPIIQGNYHEETIKDNSNIHIIIHKGCKYVNFLKKYMGFYIEVHNSEDELKLVNITIIFDSYDLSGKNLNWTYNFNFTSNLGWEELGEISFYKHFSFSEYYLKTSFIKIDVTANEKKLSKTGLRVGDYFLFLI